MGTVHMRYAAPKMCFSPKYKDVQMVIDLPFRWAQILPFFGPKFRVKVVTTQLLPERKAKIHA